MAGLYGKHWLELWATLPLPKVKQVWRDLLRDYDNETLGKALEFVKTNNRFPPTGPEFAALCRQFKPRTTDWAKLPPPRTPMPVDFMDRIRKQFGPQDRPPPGEGGPTEGER